jgi:hypothetical protein
VIRNWGDGNARVTLDGKPIAPGKDLRFGHVRSLEGTDLIIWIRTQTAHPLRVKVTLAGT